MAATLLYLSANRLLRLERDDQLHPVAPEDLKGEVSVVVDFIEATATRLTVPRAKGLDRRRLIDRRIAQEFRDTDYRAGLHLGHSDKPGHDDVLAIGIGAPKPLDAALLPGVGNGLRVRAIWTPALLAARWFRQARGAPQRALVLMVTPAGVRQILIDHGHALLGRLIARDVETIDLELLMTEVDRTVQYLRNSRLVPRDEPLPVLCWGLRHPPEAIVAALPRGLQWTQTPEARGTPSLERDGLPALMRFASRHPPAAQLAPLRVRINYLARQWRRRMLALTAALLLAITAVALPLHLQSRQLLAQAAQSDAAASAAQAPLDNLQTLIGERGYSLPIAITALGLKNTRLASLETLQRDLAALSSVIARDPGVQPVALKWRGELTGDDASAQGGPCADPATVVRLDVVVDGTVAQAEREARLKLFEETLRTSRHWALLPSRTGEDDQVLSSDALEAQLTAPTSLCLGRSAP